MVLGRTGWGRTSLARHMLAVAEQLLLVGDGVDHVLDVIHGVLVLADAAVGGAAAVDAESGSQWQQGTQATTMRVVNCMVDSGYL